VASTDARLVDVYQSLILDHSRRPRNFGIVDGAGHTARGDNPFCGDAFTVSLKLAANRIVEVAFDGAGCAISMASASMMTVGVKGLTHPQTEALYRSFDRLLGGASASELKLGDLSAFAAVSRLPVRIKCARLPWSTLLAALEGGGANVSTE
jgi:nitrogen fixation protein NifU and related proteins